MLKKPIPIKLSQEANDSVQKQLGVQVVMKSSPKSTDPKHFPVFEVQPGKKVLVYVPNHVVEGEDGPELRMDKPIIHTVLDGERYLSYRCIQGLTLEEDGKVIFDGTCPLCDGTSEPWDLANIHIKNKCTKLGVDPEDKDNETVKAIRSAEFSARVLKEANRFFTFPIVVIATKNDDGKTILYDENKKPMLQTMWYHVSEKQYVDKWLSCFEEMEDEPTHPGGHFFTLSFTYDTKGKDPNKRDAARNLKVISRNYNGSEKLRLLLDKSTEEWTPEKARETVVSNQMYSIDDLRVVADEVLAPVKDMLALMKASEMGASIEGGNENFNLKAPEKKALEGTVPQMDETDEDEGIDID